MSRRPPPAPSALHRPTSARGSLLIVAMVICAIIGVSLVSYINLGRNSLTIANRALYHNAAMNLAENGLEEAMYSVNQHAADPAYSFTAEGWEPVGATDLRRVWTDTTFDQHATGQVRVYIANALGSASPRLLARSTVTLGGKASAPIEKWIEVRLRKTSKFANGLVAKESISFSGNNASVDSWNSDPDSDPATAPIPYSTTSPPRRDNGSVGSISVAVNAVLVQNADIWGYAATGGSLPQVGSNGLVGPFGTTSGTMDMSRVSTDFSASFDPVAMPATGASVGVINNTTTLGTAGTTTTVTASSVSLASSKQLTIQGHVTLLLTAAEGTSAIAITGNAGINIAPGASLTVYTAGNIAIAGNGVANGGTTLATTNQPINFQIWGTSTSPTTDQSISIKGNGVLSGIVYAPNADVSIVGNGDVCGSVVAEDISVTGNAAFHYDESLADFGGGNPYRVSRWNEITAKADRDALTVLNF